MRMGFLGWLAVAALALAGGRAAAADTLRVGKSGGPLLLSLVELGQEAKIWDQVGLTIDSIEFAGEAKTMQALAADSIDLGFGSGIGLAFPLKGTPATAVAAISNPPNMLALVVRPDSPIKSADDLKGKTIGVSTVGSLTEWVTHELSRQKGWGTDGILAQPVGSASTSLAAITAGIIDGAVFGVGMAYETQELGRTRILLTFGPYIPVFHANVLFARNTLIAKRPEAIRLFLKGWFMALAYAHAHPDIAAQVAAKTENISPDAAAKAYDAEVFSMASTNGAFDPAAIAVIRRALKETGVLNEVPAADKLYSTQFVPVAKGG
jgi:NitT/TauT family transport system substrate-binding protein